MVRGIIYSVWKFHYLTFSYCIIVGLNGLTDNSGRTFLQGDIFTFGYYTLRDLRTLEDRVTTIKYFGLAPLRFKPLGFGQYSGDALLPSVTGMLLVPTFLYVIS